MLTEAMMFLGFGGLFGGGIIVCIISELASRDYITPKQTVSAIKILVLAILQIFLLIWFGPRPLVWVPSIITTGVLILNFVFKNIRELIILSKEEGKRE